MKNSLLAFAFMLTFVAAKAQPTTAMDFTADDCSSGNVHQLFPTLDSGHVCILEYFMNCASCIQAGQTITPMYNALAAQFPGMVHYYAFAYNNTMTCSQCNSVIVGNGVNAIPFDSGATQVAYYGGFGMPTIAVVAGNQHTVLFTHVGFTTSDTTTIGTEIRNFFLNGVGETNSLVSNMNVYPNPACDHVELKFNLVQSSEVTMQIVDPLGQVVREEQMGELTQGEHTTAVSTADLADGMYYMRLQTSEGVVSREIIISE